MLAFNGLFIWGKETEQLQRSEPSCSKIISPSRNRRRNTGNCQAGKAEMPPKEAGRVRQNWKLKWVRLRKSHVVGSSQHSYVPGLDPYFILARGKAMHKPWICCSKVFQGKWMVEAPGWAVSPPLHYGSSCPCLDPAKPEEQKKTSPSIVCTWNG